MGGRTRLGALLTSTMLGGNLLAAPPAAAQDATWNANPVNGQYNNAANWTPATVPTGTAFFGQSSITFLTRSGAGPGAVGGWMFNVGASNYTIISGTALQFNGAGIVINGGGVTVGNQSIMSFLGTSTAATASIGNNAILEFRDNSTAGTATISNPGGLLGIVRFLDNSTAANATLTNGAMMSFNNNSTAGNATITNTVSSFLTINGNATAGNATVINDANTQFRGTATAANATITTNTNATTTFFDTSTGGQARFIANGGVSSGVVDISGLANSGMTAGSIEGAGRYRLGSKTLTVGGNNLSTTVSGAVQDGGVAGGGTGGSLVKVGAGTLTLSGINTYAGGTTVNGGALVVNGSIVSSSSVTVNSGGTLGGNGSVSATTVNSGGTLSPGTSVGTLNVSGNLTFASGGGYTAEVSPSTADFINVTGTGTLAGTLTAVATGGTYTAGQFTLLTAAGGLGGSTFGNLMTQGSFSGLAASLSYDAMHVFFNLAAAAFGCNPPAGAGTPAAGTIVTCSGTVTGQNAPDGYGNGTQNGITLNVLASAQVNASGNFGSGLRLGSGNTVNVSGAVNSTQGNSGFIAIQTFNGGGTTTFVNVAQGGSVTGSNGIVNTGSGTLSVNNAGLISGAPTSVAVANGDGHIDFTNTATGQLLGSITANTIQLNNAGAIAGSANAISALTIVNGGIITGLNGVRNFSGVGDVTNTGTISGSFGIRLSIGTIFNSGIITGTGGTSIQFASTGVNTLTLAPGSVINGLAIATGAGTLQLGGNAGADTFNLNQIGPQYQGFSTFNMIGGSTWTLTGTGNQAWNVNSGTVLVSGNAGPMIVNNGGTLGGNGTVGTTVLGAGATLSPGASIGTLTVNGNLTFNAASTYIVEVSPTTADRTNVTGTANLAGTVQANFGPGTYTSNNYTILSAGSRSGTFNTLTTTGLPSFLTASLQYTATEALLVTLNSQIAQTTLCNTRNQCATAGAIDRAFNAGQGLFPGFAGLAPAQIPGALDALSGEVYGTLQSGLQDDSRYVRNAVLTRLRQAPYVGGSDALAALGFGGPDLAYADDPRAAYAANLPVKAPPLVRAAPEYVVWGSAFGAWGKLESDGNAAEAKRTLGGVISGFDRRFGDWRLGAAGGYTSSDTRIAARSSTVNIDSFHVAGYAGGRAGPLNVRGGAAFAWHDIDVHRTVAFPGFADQLRADYQGQTGQVFGEIGYARAYGRLAVEPFAGLAWVGIRIDDFTETGGAAALGVAAENHSIVYSSLGVRFATTWALANGQTLIPRASVAWQHAFSDVTPTAAVRLLSTGQSWTVAGVPIAQDSALVEAGADLVVSRNASIGLSYVGQLAGDAQDHAVKARGLLRF